jgi:hypothetical protein
MIDRRLVCPTCKREKFLNVLGFVNHCRIMHKIKFATHADAVLACGTVVNEADVPADDPSRLDTAMIYYPRSFTAPTQVRTTFFCASCSNNHSATLNAHGMAHADGEAA